MNSAEWDKLQEIFETASQYSGDRLTRFLEEHCPTAEMRAEIEDLLRYQPGSGPALRSVIEGVAGDLHHGNAQGREGARLGAWLLVRELGRGGMGTVYLASRCDGEFDQQAAIKIVNPTTASEEPLTRFRAERQVLAGLAHPNISRLFDGGATPDGLPYFVMEYLDGLPITEYCRAHDLSLPQRLRLFLPLCDAVEYAHRHQIVHRDIKPGNVLVTAEGTPKLLDFGIATLLGPSAGPSSDPGWMTPAYASPQQIHGEPGTASSDIYSLGAVLQKTLDAPGLLPIPADLGWILRKAMAARPEDRYRTVADLGRDLERFLDDLPVDAHPGGWGYRARKLLRRHRLAVSLAAAVLVIVLAGAAVALRQNFAVRQRSAELHRLLDSLVSDVDDRIRTLPGSTAARAAIVQQALDRLQRLAAEGSPDPQLRWELATAWRRVGDLQGDPMRSNIGDSAGARRSYQNAVDLLDSLARDTRNAAARERVRADLAAVYVQMVALERVAGNSARAEELLGKVSPLIAGMSRQTGESSREVLARYHLLYAWTADLRGRTPEARDHAAQSVAVYRGLAQSDPRFRIGLTEALSLLSGREALLGDIEGAMQHYREELAIHQQLAAENPSDRAILRGLMLSWGQLGYLVVSHQSNDFKKPDSLAGYQEMLAIARRLVALDPTDRTARLDLANALGTLGDSQSELGLARPAIASYLEGLGVAEELSKQDPANRRAISWVEYLNRQVARQWIRIGEFAKAKPALEKSLAICRGVLAADSANTTFLADYLGGLRTQADYFARTGSSAEARASAHEAIALAGKIAASTANVRLRASLPVTYEELARVYLELHDRSGAEDLYRKSFDAWNAMQPLPGPYINRPARVAAALAALHTKP